jgi:mannitol-1-phosphate 5-dehydrogenase
MKALILGGGKIARGFIAHLLHLSKASFVFVDVNEDLVKLINQRRRYTIHIMGNEEKNCEISDARAIHLMDKASIVNELAGTDIIFTCVGGKNLQMLGSVLADVLREAFRQSIVDKPLNIVTCENWKNPAGELAHVIKENLLEPYLSQFDQLVGVTEAVVMRSGVESPAEVQQADPLSVHVSNYWELPIDRERIIGAPPSLFGCTYIDQFSGFLERKFYTYNAANGTVSYIGFLKNHRYLFEAATDPDIVPILDGVYKETCAALAQKYGIDLAEQETFARSSKAKLQDPNIVDYIERNARDPIRKLGPDDRLVGSARLCMQYGIVPHHLAIAIAAAIH